MKNILTSFYCQTICRIIPRRIFGIPPVKTLRSRRKKTLIKITIYAQKTIH